MPVGDFTRVCMNVNCGLTSSGECLQCGIGQPRRFDLSWPPVGCVCPPTSEQTCKNPTCPRQPPKPLSVGLSSPSVAVEGGASAP
jgi:hypothetical protein